MNALAKENSMIARIMCAACTLAGLVMLASCSGLESKYYPGEPIAISQAHLSDESIWRYRDDVYYVMRTSSNTFAAATLKWDEKKGAYIAQPCKLVASQLGGYVFLNIKGGSENYTIFRATYDGGDSAVLFSAHMEKIKQDMTNGLVRAHMENKNTITLDGSKEEQAEYIRNNIHSMFDMDSPSFAKLIIEKKSEEKPPAKSAE